MRTRSENNAYSRFGSLMLGRVFSSEGEGYRYGFNTQEKDDEVYGEGNVTTAEFWEYDARLGRRWNVDPVSRDYESVYSCFINNPILCSDHKGDQPTKRFGILRRVWNSVIGRNSINKANKFASENNIDERNVSYNRDLGIAVVIQFQKTNNSTISEDGKTHRGESSVRISATFFTDKTGSSQEYYDLFENKLI